MARGSSILAHRDRMPEPGYISGSCESCGRHIEFPADGLGMSVSCPHCGQSTTLLEDLGSRETDGAISAAELSAAFNGPIRRYRISFIYQIALLLVACFMVILPVLYVRDFALTSRFVTLSLYRDEMRLP